MRGVILLVLVLVSCSSTSEPSGSASAGAACEHFHNVASDFSDGIMTQEELREKLREVDSAAAASDDTQVKSAAREMFAAVTSGTEEEFNDAVRSMSSACDRYRGG